MAKVAKTFRLNQETADKLEELSKTTGKTATAIVEEAIRDCNTTSTQGNTQSDAVLDVLVEQLQVKDDQIAALNQALVHAQETAKAAQVLQASSIAGELPEKTGGQERQSWWQRLFG